MKGVNDEDLFCLADEYILIERRVAGEGETFECDEGHKNLKNLYVIKSVEDGRIIRLGRTCLENLTGLSGDVVNALVKCFDGIDREYERILLAYHNGQWEGQKEYRFIKDLPANMKRQLEIGLPLSDLQLSKVKKQINEYIANKERSRSVYQKAGTRQAYYTYNEILGHFEDILSDIKANKDIISGKCPGTFRRVVAMIERAKEGEEIKGRDLILELQGVSNAMAWKYEFY